MVIGCSIMQFFVVNDDIVVGRKTAKWLCGPYPQLNVNISTILLYAH